MKREPVLAGFELADRIPVVGGESEFSDLLGAGDSAANFSSLIEIELQLQKRVLGTDQNWDAVCIDLQFFRKRPEGAGD